MPLLPYHGSPLDPLSIHPTPLSHSLQNPKALNPFYKILFAPDRLRLGSTLVLTLQRTTRPMMTANVKLYKVKLLRMIPASSDRDPGPAVLLRAPLPTHQLGGRKPFTGCLRRTSWATLTTSCDIAHPFQGQGFCITRKISKSMHGVIGEHGHTCALILILAATSSQDCLRDFLS